eukprot:5742-Pelagomonas_calceolata.AAC.2
MADNPPDSHEIRFWRSPRTAESSGKESLPEGKNTFHEGSKGKSDVLVFLLAKPEEEAKGFLGSVSLPT